MVMLVRLVHSLNALVPIQVKTAVFSDDKHVFDVSEALKENNVERLLILGTSDGMVAKIAKRLGLHGIDETVYIFRVNMKYNKR